ncbi:hypothetical protein, partial [Romboutsia sp. 13368]|uniref:hypothetical protein n=1 Tax=Romboutsia sp. 13368 TaxID=2708053 RepID=UPI0025E30E00
ILLQSSILLISTFFKSLLNASVNHFISRFLIHPIINKKSTYNIDLSKINEVYLLENIQDYLDDNVNHNNHFKNI